MAKRHPSVIATCVVTQQAQRRHSADISEREHRPQRLAKVCHRRLMHPHQRDVFRSHDRQSVAGVAWPESAATASPELALDVCGSDAPASSAATLLARRKRVRSRHEGAGLRRVTTQRSRDQNAETAASWRRVVCQNGTASGLSARSHARV